MYVFGRNPRSLSGPIMVLLLSRRTQYRIIYISTV